MERELKRSRAASSTQRHTVAENLDALPEFVTKRATQAGFRAGDARWLSAAEGSESKGDLARFLVDLRPGLRLGAIQGLGDDPEHLSGGHFRIFRRHAIVEADDVLAGREEQADCCDEPRVRNHWPLPSLLQRS